MAVIHGAGGGATALLSAVLACGSAWADEPDPAGRTGAYAGVELGWFGTNPTFKRDLLQAVGNAYPNVEADTDAGAAVYGLAGGYRFSRHFGAELAVGHAYGYGAKVRLDSGEELLDGTKIPLTSWSWVLCASALAYWPVHRRMDLSARLGSYVSDARGKISKGKLEGVAVSATQRNNAIFGAGITFYPESFAFANAPPVSFDLAWTRYKGNYDTDVYSARMKYHF